MIELTGYKILDRIYSGTRTLVYRGTRICDETPVAIKFLRNEYPSFSELVQFRNQYAIAKNLNLPGIIQTYSLEAYQNSYALIVEDFGGISLKEWTGKGETLPSLVEFFRIAIDMSNILDRLCRDRIIHKDIKPANIRIEPKTKQIKLIDFSIASLLPRETQTLMNPNVLEGTLSYLSPEQTGRMNRGIDYRTDFYSLDVTFYELLTGKLPFQSSEPMELIHCHIAKQPPSVREINPEIPVVLSSIVSKLMAKNAENRYQSAFGLKADLETCLLLYLENSVTAGAFTADRIELLKLLCSQAAISLENARLYQKSQQALENLQQAQLQLIQQQEYPDRTPAILDEIEAIDLDFLRADLPNLIGSMTEGIDRICNVSVSLRTFSRVDSDRPLPFNIHEGIDSTLVILKHRLKADDTRPPIEVVKNYGNLPAVECFAGQLNLVFMNFLANAIDALEESNFGRSYQEIEANPNLITITTAVFEDKKSAIIRIKDHGIGMSESVQQQIFDRLFTTKAVGKGTGLGLAIARQIVLEKHRGTIEVNSVLGEGTEFAIVLPGNSL